MNYFGWNIHISHVYFLSQYLYTGTKLFDLVTLTLKFDLLLKKSVNLGHNFLTRRGKTFISRVYFL